MNIICATAGSFGNHVRWLALLDSKYSFEVDNHTLVSTAPDYIPFIENENFSFTTAQSKLDAFENWIYPATRDYYNWLIHEWKYRTILNQYIQLSHEYHELSNPDDKVLWLSISDETALKCYYKFNPTLNFSSIKNFLNFKLEPRELTDTDSSSILTLKADDLYSEILNEHFYTQLVDFFELENNYELACKIHLLWYHAHERSEQHFLSDVFRIYKFQH
jgi:hypothetical protein